MRSFPAPVGSVLRGVSSLWAVIPWLVAAGAFLVAALVLIRRLRGNAGDDSALIRAASFILLSFAGPALLVLPFKHAIGRARPVLLDHHGHLFFRPFAFDDHFSSFPSAQAAMAAGMACSLGFVFPKRRAAFIAIGMVVCATRQLVGAHWASDTIVGWAIGTSFSLWLAHRVAQHHPLFSCGTKSPLE
jgi:membrane-associated phospholipid phosphatase